MDYGLHERYRLKVDRFEHKAGTLVYRCHKHDYGCSRDDSLYTGIEHRAFTLDENGDYPFFTVALRDVELA